MIKFYPRFKLIVSTSIELSYSRKSSTNNTASIVNARVYIYKSALIKEEQTAYHMVIACYFRRFIKLHQSLCKYT